MKVIVRGREVFIDEQDAHLFLAHEWHLINPRGEYPQALYVRRRETIDGKRVLYLLHREIMNAPKGMVVDHIDGNVLNNQRANLRVCTHADNMKNRKLSGKGTKGICLHKRRTARPWAAYIQSDMKRVHIGYFDTAEEAAQAYARAAKLFHGEFARLA